MPLVGIIDPGHAEARRQKPGRLPNWLTLNEAITLSENDPKWAPWPTALLSAMFGEHQERDYISTSMLVAKCGRSAVIERMEDFIGDVKSLYLPFRGTMVHRTLEAYAPEGTLAEYRFFTTIAGEEVSCSPDTLTRDTLSDWKFTESPPMYNYPWAEHTEQVQFNAHIVRNATAYKEPGRARSDVFESLPFDPRLERAENLVVVYLGPKGTKVLAVEKTAEVLDPEKNKFVKAKVSGVWSDKTAEKIMKPRVEAMRAALDSYPVWPAGLEDEWGGAPDWRCPGPPLCYFDCLAKRWPNGLTWEKG